ncbi:hypothetical protein CHS0354_021934 [Potamilus streckersoni]|uniref:Uncharacterized protein n=1 Tax=Potamilus streckersoni TaxID=2493646 RepID=A0AAE0SKF0_9BIVA|nr:hypothetical protein CHS0354_021934 [Potamilus streckersoni]
MTYIQQIIQLLEDPVSLKSIEDCKAAVGNIQKIDNDSLDIHFNLDIEMTGLRSAVNDIRRELGVQEKISLDTAESLKEEYEQLRQQLTERFADLENKLETIKIEVKEQHEKYQELHKARLDKVEKNVQVILMQRKKRKRKRKTARKRISKYGTSVNPVQRRPESDVLRSLQTSSTACNYTEKELLDAWQSIEEYLLEELAPKNLLTYFKDENILSAEECTSMCLLSRSQAAEMLLECMKAKLPESFWCLLHAFNETKQEVIVLGLRQKIEEIQKLLNMAQSQVPNEPAPDMAYYTLKLELLKDGNTVHDTEMKTRGFFDRGRIVFQYDLKSESLKWEHGSVIVHLRPLKRHSKETLAFFCRHGGMKDFVLDLLKKKDIFASLPEGEMTIHMQVCCYDTEFEDADVKGRDVTQMAEKNILSPHDSFRVTDDPHVIRQNLLFQYEYLLEEIEPLQFQDTFVTTGIWDTSLLEKLKMLTKRRARAADFLKQVLDKGNTAIAALVHALRNSGNNKVAEGLCTVQEMSAQFRDEGQIDGSIEVIQEELITDDQECVLWSCHLNVEVRKNEDGGLTKGGESFVLDQRQKTIGHHVMKPTVDSSANVSLTPLSTTYSYQEPSRKSFMDLTVLELCEQLKLCGLEQMIEVCKYYCLDGKFLSALDKKSLRESPFNLTDDQMRKYHDMMYRNWDPRQRAVGYYVMKPTVASSANVSLTPSSTTYSYQEPSTKSFRDLTVLELCERLKFCRLEQMIDVCKNQKLDGAFMDGLDERFLRESPFSLTENQMRKYHCMMYINWVPKKNVIGHSKTKSALAFYEEVVLTPSTVDLHTKEKPVLNVRPSFKNFRHLSVSELCERLKLCGLEQLIETCKIEILDGEFMYGLEEEFLAKSPFNLTEFQIRKYFYMAYKNWVPKLS